jgi:hypothetical protein
MRKQNKEMAELVSITKEKAENDKRMSAWRVRRESIIDSRDKAYNDYDKLIKDLALQHAQSYMIDNDRTKLEKSIHEVERAKESFKRENLEYHEELKKIMDEMLKLTPMIWESSNES